MELNKERLQRTKIFVLAGPQDRFTEDEFEVLKEYVEQTGGSLLVLLGEGGEQEFNTNVNFFLEQYGIYINGDNVVRPHYYKNFHPKECIVGGGVVCESMWRHLLKRDIEKVDYDFSDEKYKLHFQYPYGATLNVSEPANVLLTTGPVVYPFNRPLAGYYSNAKGGKILALGSGYMWHDKYLQDKTNDAMLEYLLQLLGTNNINYTHLDFNDVEVGPQRESLIEIFNFSLSLSSSTTTNTLRIWPSWPTCPRLAWWTPLALRCPQISSKCSTCRCAR